MSDRRKQTAKQLTEHFQRYPEMQIKDMFKFLHQSAFGCEHLLTEEMAAIEYIRKEAEACNEHRGELTESLDGSFCRVHLDWIKRGLSAETLGKLFLLSAKPIEDGKELLEVKLAVLTELVKERRLPYQEEEIRKEIEKWRNDGYPACHHSDKFRDTYFPAYRVIKKEYATFLPVFFRIDQRLQSGKVTLAIEGGSASGKTTLSKLLEQIYGATVFYMDDFFLRPEQRTKERFAEPGGNVDRERFLEEVLIPMKENKPISYRCFNCSTFEIEQPIEMHSGKVNIIEGAYSMHPELAGYYDFSVFLDIEPKLQVLRVNKRNSPEMAERFFEEWIPLEQRYFEAMKVKERCNMVISIFE